MSKIYPSLIAADLMNLRAEIQNLDTECDGFHLDVMDNHFVPNLTWGPDFINQIANTTQKPLWVHLMVDDPTDWIEKFNLPSHSTIEIHIESEGHVRQNLQRIKERHLNAGIVLNPKTKVETIFPHLDLVDSVLIMSVEPGFSGQDFIPSVTEKIKSLIGYQQQDGIKFDIGMDGAIGPKNIANLQQKKVDWFAIGSSIFNQPNRVKALRELKQLLK